jgi:hypothetical protein
VTSARVTEPEPGATTEARLPWVVCIPVIAALSAALWAAVGLLIWAVL